MYAPALITCRPRDRVIARSPGTCVNVEDKSHLRERLCARRRGSTVRFYIRHHGVQLHLPLEARYRALKRSAAFSGSIRSDFSVGRNKGIYNVLFTKYRVSPCLSLS